MSGRVYSATYIGGHPDFQKKENVRIYLASDELKIAPLAIKIKYSDIKETEITKVGFEKFLKIKYSEDSSIYELFFSDIPNIDELNNELKKLREKPLIEEVKKITEKEKIVFIIAIFIIIVIILFIPLIPYEKAVTYPIIKTITETYPVTKVVDKIQTLFEGNNLYISTWGYRYSGPYYLKAGQTITVKWDADTTVNVYIMNDRDWANRFLGAPISERAFKYGTSGEVSYTLKYDEPIYVQVMSPVWASAKLYAWKETVSWQEQVTIYETLTKQITNYETRTIVQIVSSADLLGWPGLILILAILIIIFGSYIKPKKNI
jgi:hypothetical protein